MDCNQLQNTEAWDGEASSTFNFTSTSLNGDCGSDPPHAVSDIDPVFDLVDFTVTDNLQELNQLMLLRGSNAVAPTPLIQFPPIDAILDTTQNIESTEPSVVDASFGAVQPNACSASSTLDITNLIDSNSSSTTTSRAKPIDTLTWEKHKDTIKSLFPTHTLENLLAELLGRGFPVTKKALNSKLTEWKRDGVLPKKNISKADMDFMVRIRHEHEEQGKYVQFSHNGFEVSDEKLRKHRRRFGIVERGIVGNSKWAPTKIARENMLNCI
jgi:hypothetical protein